MSLARRSKLSTSLLLGQLHADKNAGKVSSIRPALTLSTQLQLILLSTLAFLQKAQGAFTDTIYAFEPSTNTNYQLDYNSAELSGMKSTLMDYCNMILFSTPQTAYSYAASPQCEFASSSSGPLVSVAVEVGKDITSSFMSCFSDGMRDMCDDYYDNNYRSGGGSGGVLGLVIFIGSIVVVIGAAIAIYACFNSRCCRRHEDHHDNHFKTDYGTTSSVQPIVPATSSAYYSGPVVSSSPVIYTPPPPPVYTPPPVVVIPMPEPEPVHHHHDHGGHHSTVTWHK